MGASLWERLPGASSSFSLISRRQSAPMGRSHHHDGLSRQAAKNFFLTIHRGAAIDFPARNAGGFTCIPLCRYPTRLAATGRFP